MHFFSIFYFMSQVLAVSAVILTVLWVVIYMGLVWKISDVRLYNWHAIFMVLGMVFFCGNSILIFRMFRKTAKKTAKIIHAALHAIAFIFIALGLAVEFISHAYHKEPNLYSLHGWLGMATVVLFSGQFIFGSVCYLCPLVKERLKALYMPFHVFFGIACFIMSIATCVGGLNQIARFNMVYEALPLEGILINVIGVTLAIYGILVVYLVTKSSYRRQPAPSNKIYCLRI